jgi:hypothetical protein
MTDPTRRLTKDQRNEAITLLSDMLAWIRRQDHREEDRRVVEDAVDSVENESCLAAESLPVLERILYEMDERESPVFSLFREEQVAYYRLHWAELLDEIEHIEQALGMAFDEEPEDPHVEWLRIQLERRKGTRDLIFAEIFRAGEPEEREEVADWVRGNPDRAAAHGLSGSLGEVPGRNPLS